MKDLKDKLEHKTSSKHQYLAVVVGNQLKNYFNLKLN